MNQFPKYKLFNSVDWSSNQEKKIISSNNTRKCPILYIPILNLENANN